MPRWNLRPFTLDPEAGMSAGGSRASGNVFQSVTHVSQVSARCTRARQAICPPRHRPPNSPSRVESSNAISKTQCLLAFQYRFPRS